MPRLRVKKTNFNNDTILRYYLPMHKIAIENLFSRFFFLLAYYLVLYKLFQFQFTVQSIKKRKMQFTSLPCDFNLFL